MLNEMIYIPFIERFHTKLDDILPSLTTNIDFIDLENGSRHNSNMFKSLSRLTAVQIIFKNKAP